MPRKRSQKSKTKISRQSWDALPSGQQEARERALSVLAKMRQGSPLYPAAREVGIDPRTALRHLAVALTKREGKYRARKVDRISRGMVVYSSGKQLYIIVNDSRVASTIGKYFNAVRQLLHAGDDMMLRTFEGVAVTDNRLVRYFLETDPKRILAIESAREEPEFFQIYRIGG